MDKLIQNFSIKSVADFFKNKISSFSPNSENLDYILKDADFAHFSDLQKIGEVEFNNSDELIVFTCKFQGVLSERSSKKRQFEIAKKVLKEDFKDGAIFIFYDDNDCFRFSFIRKNYGNKDQKFTNWKRYTYFVDPARTNKTFKNRINGCNFSSLEDIQEAFSVEKLTKQFYNELFNWYQWAVSSDDGFEVTYPNDISTDKDDRQIEEHLIRLITRLMFVWFIKKKKLIPNEIFEIDFLEKALIDFDPNSKSNGNYYNAVIQNLFFASLNKPIDERTFATGKNHQGKDEHYGIKTLFRDNNNKSWFQKEQNEIIDLFKGVPFLNGGLFECLDKENEDGKIFYYDGFSRVEGRQKRAFLPNCIFFDEQKGIIPLLERYNFTLEENSTDDIEVALDPELLGKVFENLLGAYNPETKETARKQSGSFYTPREIVDYMVNESIFQYLKNECPTVDEVTISQLLNTDEVAEGLTNSNSKAIANALRNIKILDPACGSGAFPMGVLNTLFKTLKKVEPQTDKLSNYELKLELIENCIYGVDIQSIAVQISKLRFFISLVCEQETTTDLSSNYGIKSLPNLETKFVAANTLIGLKKEAKTMIEWQDETLSELKIQLWDIRCHQNFRAQKWQEKKLLRQQDKDLCKKIEDYLKTIAAKPNLAVVEEHKQQIAKQEIEIANLPEIWLDTTETVQQTSLFESISNKPQSLFKIDTNKEKRELLKKSNKQLLKKIELETNKQHFADTSEANALIKWNPYDQNTSSPFFDPEWMFSVEKFDVIIGNPPYVEAKKLKHISPHLKKFKVYSGTADLSSYFFEQGLDLCKPSGILSYINTNKFFTTGYGKPLRALIIENEIKQLLNFEQVEVFENVLVSSVILSIKKTVPKTVNSFPFKKFYKIKNAEFISSFAEKIKNRESYNQNDLTDAEWSFADNSNLILKLKIESNSIKLIDIEGVSIYRGVTTGYNPAFIINDEKKQELIKADGKNNEVIKSLLQGRNIRKWVYNESDENLLFTKQGMDIEKYPSLKNHLMLFYNELKPRSGIETGGRKPGSYRWFEIQDNTAYYNEFEKSEKIIWGLTADKWAYAFDDKQHYLPSNGYILTSQETPIKYLLALINSNLLKYYFGFIGVMTAGGAFTLKHATIQQLPFKLADNQKIFIEIVNQILENKKDNIETINLEAKIDLMVYKLYELTYDEVLLVEPEFSLSKQEYDNYKI